MLSEEDLRNAAWAMRKAFFDRLKPLEEMDADELGQVTGALFAIHTGELLDVAARFGEGDPRETVMLAIDAMLADPDNAAEFAAIRGENNPLTYLTGGGN